MALDTQHQSSLLVLRVELVCGGHSVLTARRDKEVLEEMDFI